MAQGKLPLSNYRNFLEQDAAYFEHVADVYRLAAIKMEIQKKKRLCLFLLETVRKIFRSSQAIHPEKRSIRERPGGYSTQSVHGFPK